MSLLDELLGKTTTQAPADPWEASEPTKKRNQHDPAHPLVGTAAPLTPPPTPGIETERLIAQDVYQRFGKRLDTLQGTLETLVALQKAIAERNIPVTQSIYVGPNAAAATYLATQGRPYLRLWVSSYQSVVLGIPGASTMTRELVPGWNTLDVPDRTRIYSNTNSGFNAIVQASDTPTQTPNPVAVAGEIQLSNPPAQTNVGADTSLVFSSPVGHWFIQNNTAASVNWDLETAANAGSPVIAAGQMITSDIPLSQLHLFTAAAQNINGSTSGNIVIRGWI